MGQDSKRYSTWSTKNTSDDCVADTPFECTKLVISSVLAPVVILPQSNFFKFWGAYANVYEVQPLHVYLGPLA